MKATQDKIEDTGNAGCDRCGMNDREPGIRFCKECYAPEWESHRDAVPEWHVQYTIFDTADGERVATVFGSLANVHLVEAAPDAFAALKLVDDDYDSTGCDGCGTITKATIKKVRAAIAKAKASR